MAAGGHDDRTMSDTHDTTHGAGDETHDTTHGAGDETNGAGHDDGHGHVSEPLGPIGWAMWGAGVLGVLVAAVMTAVFAVATGFVPGA
jgi:hypothetical protein